MHHHKGHNLEIANADRLMRQDLVEADSRYAWIAVLCKAIRQHLQHALTSRRISIHIDGAKLTIGSYIIHSPHMIIMGMGNQYAVNLAEGLCKNLLTEIRAAVDEQSRCVCFH